MRFKESIAIDSLIQERRQSLARENLSEHELDQRAEALMVLIEARNELDRIGSTKSDRVPLMDRQKERYRRSQQIVGSVDVSDV